MILDIREDMKEVNKMFRSLSGNIVPNAISGAINKTLTSVRAEAARNIKKEVNMKVGQIKKSIIIVKSNKKRLVGHYIVIPANEGKGLNLIEFVKSSRRNTTAFRKKQGVIARAWEKEKLYKNAFIGKAKSSGKLLVYKRDKSKASGVKALPAASIPSTYFKKEILNSINKFGKATFTKKLQQEINFRLSKLR